MSPRGGGSPTSSMPIARPGFACSSAIPAARARPSSAGKRWTRLYTDNWPLIAASDVAWSQSNQSPRPMTRDDMDEVRDQFVAAVRMAVDAGFDMIEMHAAHGYLLSSFITPLQNKRSDEYGGSLENRLRFPLESSRRCAKRGHPNGPCRFAFRPMIGQGPPESRLRSRC